MRTLPIFLLMMIFCFIYSVKLEYDSQTSDLNFMKTSLESFTEAYQFTWGENLSGWLEFPDGTPRMFSMIWLLVTHIVFLNLMISVSGAVYGEMCENWTAKSMSTKNELILYCERLYAFSCTTGKREMNYFINDDEGKYMKYILYVENDVDKVEVIQKSLDEKFGLVEEKVDMIQQNLDEKFGVVEAKVDLIKAEMAQNTEKAEKIQNDLTEVKEIMEDKFSKLNEKLDKIL